MLFSGAPAFAQKQSSAGPRAKVLAQLPLGGVTVRRIIGYDAKRKHYLYLMLSANEDYRVVDVSKPAHPELLDKAAIPAPPVTQEVKAIGDGLGIGEAPAAGEKTTAPGEAGAINILDLSDPAHPRTLLSVRGVTGRYTDPKRRLIYLANSDGLTVVAYRPSPRPMPFCSSTDAMSINPDCQ